MNLYRLFAGLFFVGYLYLAFFPLSVPVWIPITILAILYFLIIERENISYYFSFTSIAFVVQLAGGLSSPLFISYLPIVFILKKRGLKLKLWWLILPLFSLFKELYFLPYLKHPGEQRLLLASLYLRYKAVSAYDRGTWELSW